MPALERLLAVLLSLPLFLPIAHAQAQITPDAIAQLPPCVLTCAVQVLPRFNCAPGDSCFCDTKGPLAKAVEDCIFVECPLIEDKLKAAKSQAEMCHRPVRNRAHVLAFISYIFFALSAVSMVLRVISRLPSAGGPGFGMDDWAIIACFPLAIALAVITAFEVRYGVGQDAWMLDSYTLEKFLMWFLIPQPVYVLATHTIKLALVLLYMRIWSKDHQKIRIACKIVMALIMTALPINFFINIFACRPISYNWTVIHGGEGKCGNRVASAMAAAVLNIVFDIVVIVLPMPGLWRSLMSTRKKLGVMSVFAMGFLVTACSCVRLAYITSLSSPTNPTWDLADLSLWTVIEVYLSVICCNMPTLAGLFRRWWHKAAETISSKLSSRQSSSNKNKGSRSSDHSKSFITKSLSRYYLPRIRPVSEISFRDIQAVKQDEQYARSPELPALPEKPLPFLPDLESQIYPEKI